MKVLSYAIALDGGTQVLDLELDNGDIMHIGLDGRMDSPLSGKQLFVGASPGGPETRLLPIGGSDEAGVIELLEQWMHQVQLDGRNDEMINSDPADLSGQKLRDRMAIEFLLQIRRRDLG